MIERSLRVRKNPKYLNSDEQDPDKVSFAQLKSHHDHSLNRDHKAQDAKILLKFIQKVNKSYKAYLNEPGHHATLAQKHQQAHRDKKAESAPETSKKTSQPSKQIKKEQPSKAKPTATTKSQPQQQREQQLLKAAESSMNTLKQSVSGQQITGIGKGIFTDQLKKLQSMYPEMKNISYQSLTQNINPNLFSGMTVQKKKEPQQKSVFAQEKLFKRSAYHVAIAYHIHLKNLRQKGGMIGNEIDPTYFARRLKDNQYGP